MTEFPEPSDLDAELAALEAVLMDWLAGEPAGIGEHQLLRRLRDDGHPGFPPDLFLDSLTLFRAHFRLFHLLYRLRERLVAERCGTLEIGPLCIRLRTFHPEGEPPSAGRAIGEVDGLRDYYLDPSHLLHTTAEEVEAMLGAFWRRFYAHRQRDEALGILGLADPVDGHTIRLQYRRLAMQHHPDRGGDARQFHAIRQAMKALREEGR